MPREQRKPQALKRKALKKSPARSRRTATATRTNCKPASDAITSSETNNWNENCLKDDDSAASSSIDSWYKEQLDKQNNQWAAQEELEFEFWNKKQNDQQEENWEEQSFSSASSVVSSSSSSTLDSWLQQQLHKQNNQWAQEDFEESNTNHSHEENRQCHYRRSHQFHGSYYEDAIFQDFSSDSEDPESIHTNTKRSYDHQDSEPEDISSTNNSLSSQSLSIPHHPREQGFLSSVAVTPDGSISVKSKSKRAKRAKSTKHTRSSSKQSTNKYRQHRIRLYKEQTFATAHPNHKTSNSTPNPLVLFEKEPEASSQQHHIIEKIVLTASNNKVETLFQYIFRNITLNIEMVSVQDNLCQPVPISIHNHDGIYELVSLKDKEMNKGGALFRGAKMEGRMSSAPAINYVYIRTKDASGKQSYFDLASQLLKLGDFEALSIRKTVARFELLQSKAQCTNHTYYIKTFPSNIFSLQQEDHGCAGCGFINGTFLDQLTGMHHSLAIQVRIIVPKYGIFKGMLFRKNFTFAESLGKDGVMKQIILPPSMQKVPRAPNTERYDVGIILVNTGGVAPGRVESKASKFKYEIDTTIDAPSKNSIFDTREKEEFLLRRKRKGEMTRNLLEKSLKVPTEIIDHYNRQMVRRGGLKHAFVYGVADPYEKLRPGEVFVTGLTSVQRGEYLVTRMPAMKVEDARLLKNVRTKPLGMDETDWQEWTELPFGVIIFGSPEEGMKTIPEQISGGDLDGDYYCVFWEDSIVDYVRDNKCVIPVTYDVPVEEEDCWKGNKDDLGEPRDPSWLEKVQNHMSTLASEMKKVDALKCILHNLSKDSKDIDDKNCYWDAFSESLDYHKHGRKMKLPGRLLKNIDFKFLPFFHPPEDPE